MTRQSCLADVGLAAQRMFGGQIAITPPDNARLSCETPWRKLLGHRATAVWLSNGSLELQCDCEEAPGEE